MQGRPSREETQLKNRLRLAEIKVPLVTELGRAKVKLKEPKKRQEGDIARLPIRIEDPVTIHLGGKPKRLAWPFGKRRSEGSYNSR